jgi:putative ABC transport system permease protein
MVLTNTMIMTARERTREYAVLKSIGFSRRHLAGLIGGEALLIAVLGGGIGLLITYPLAAGVHKGLPSGWFPIFSVEPETAAIAAAAALAAGIFAALIPMNRVLRTKIVDGLRKVV